MKKRFVLALMVCFTAGSLWAIAPAGKKNFVGEWKFNIPHAPNGYQQGTISIVENKGNLNGEIMFSDGEKIKMEEMSVTNGVLKFQIYVESGYVNGKATIENDKFKGTANTPEGNIPFEAAKVRKKDKE